MIGVREFFSKGNMFFACRWILPNIFLLFLLFQTVGASICKADTLLLATTTSTQDSGLLDILSPIFTEETGISLQWVSVGTGKALALAKNCDVDVVLVHAPETEKAFMQDGYASRRHLVMYNNFIIVGPQSDPAHIEGKSAPLALKSLSEKGELFVSRGDNSGTHIREQAIWKQTGMTAPQKEKWYYSVGQGMMHTLNIASEKHAYTLTDSGTWIQFQHKNPHTELRMLIATDETLFNQYSVLELEPRNCPRMKKDLAARFAKWMTSSAVQKRIADFKVQGKQLFFPNASPIGHN